MWPAAELDLFVDGRPAMGQAWRTDRKSAKVAILARGVPADSHVHLIVGKCDRGGATPAITDESLKAHPFRSGVHETTLHRGDGQYLRIEVHDPHDNVIGFSNPFWILPAHHPADIPTARRFR